VNPPVVVDELVGRFPGATNTTVLGRIDGDLVIYKPIAGNRPLWDFDVATLAQREVLAHRVAVAAGLDVVPETTLGDGPLGPGAVQRFVVRDETFDPLPMARIGDPSLWPIALLDAVINNADRKLGHILRDHAGRLWAIDHGLSFHHDDKLRTVLWSFAGMRLPAPMLGALHRLSAALAGGLTEEVAAGLGDAEASALGSRVAGLLEQRVHPHPPEHRPPVPWPPY
jgi:hypothetical protein